MAKLVTSSASDHLLEVARDVARRAGAGIGTLYRHFSTREFLLEALLRESFDKVTAKAGALETSGLVDDALVSRLREMVALTHNHRGLIAAMTAAIADPAADAVLVPPGCIDV